MSDHPLPVVRTPDPDRVVLTSLPRGRDADHQLVCGSCGAVVAQARRPMTGPAPLLRCNACDALNDAGALPV